MTDAGRARRTRAQGAKSDALHALMTDLDPAIGEWIDGFIFEDVWGRPGLDHDERMLVAIASLTTSGHHGQLRNYLWGAVQDGIAPEKVTETILMLVVYAGFPAALSALTVWKEIESAAIRQGLISGAPSAG